MAANIRIHLLVKCSVNICSVWREESQKKQYLNMVPLVLVNLSQSVLEKNSVAFESTSVLLTVHCKVVCEHVGQAMCSHRDCQTRARRGGT